MFAHTVAEIAAHLECICSFIHVHILNAHNSQRGINPARAILGEFLCTMLLCIVVLAATTSTLGLQGYSTEYTFRGGILPLAIGLTVTVSHFVLIPVDNCSIDPGVHM